MVYVGLSYYGPALGDNEYLSFLLSSLVEIPSYLACWVVMDWWGRRWPLSICMMLSGISCIVTVLLPEGQFSFSSLTYMMQDLENLKIHKQLLTYYRCCYCNFSSLLVFKICYISFFFNNIPFCGRAVPNSDERSWYWSLRIHSWSWAHFNSIYYIFGKKSGDEGQ